MCKTIILDAGISIFNIIIIRRIPHVYGAQVPPACMCAYVRAHICQYVPMCLRACLVWSMCPCETVEVNNTHQRIKYSNPNILISDPTFVCSVESFNRLILYKSTFIRRYTSENGNLVSCNMPTSLLACLLRLFATYLCATMCLRAYTQLRACVPMCLCAASVHACLRAYVQPPKNAGTDPSVPRCLRAACAPVCLCVPPCRCACVPTCLRAYVPTCLQAYGHACVPMCLRGYDCTHVYVPTWLWLLRVSTCLRAYVLPCLHAYGPT
jgi:hypothetical protein